MNKQLTDITIWLGIGSINVFGRPFAGKDTQGRILAEAFGGVMISSGDILRHSQNNPEVQELMAAGDIIPSEAFEQIVLPYFSRMELRDKPLILSEVGRVKAEAQVIMKAATDSNHPVKAVIVLQLSEEVVWQRFEAAQKLGDRGQRADDNRDVLQTRLDEYKEKVLPVIDLYRDNGLLIEVDGSRSREEVTEEILACLATRAATKY